LSSPDPCFIKAGPFYAEWGPFTNRKTPLPPILGQFTNVCTINHIFSPGPPFKIKGPFLSVNFCFIDDNIGKGINKNGKKQQHQLATASMAIGNSMNSINRKMARSRVTRTRARAATTRAMTATARGTAPTAARGTAPTAARAMASVTTAMVAMVMVGFVGKCHGDQGTSLNVGNFCLGGSYDSITGCQPPGDCCHKIVCSEFCANSGICW